MFSIALHGGAGVIEPNMLTSEKETAYKNALNEALQIGKSILEKGGDSLEAVTKTVMSLEDCPLFNAGKGAVFNSEGKHEMDASLMRGDNLEAGAVGAISGVKNPILLCKNILEESEHVYLSGIGALEFAKQMNAELRNDEYFFDQFRYDQFLVAQKSGNVQLDHAKNPLDVQGTPLEEKKFGTVGAVAIDEKGNLAAATSTGGMTNKKFGRVGDTPIIGSGTYANNNTCAVSATGHGEYFIRAVVAYDISCLMEYKGFSLQEACAKVVKNKLVKLKGEGGVIAIDNKGNIELCFNSSGMYRASTGSDKEDLVAIYG
jgi:beta-aspartyl-peptidase (threonine type)